jgi:hypothetical protein
MRSSQGQTPCMHVLCYIVANAQVSYAVRNLVLEEFHAYLVRYLQSSSLRWEVPLHCRIEEHAFSSEFIGGWNKCHACLVHVARL